MRLRRHRAAKGVRESPSPFSMRLQQLRWRDAVGVMQVQQQVAVMRRVRFRAQPMPERGDCVLELPLSPQQPAESVVRVRVTRVDPNRRANVRFRRAEHAVVGEQRRQVVVRLCVIRLVAQRGLVRRLRVGERGGRRPGLRRQQDAEVVPRLRVVRPHADRPAAGGDRFTRPPEFVQRQGEVVRAPRRSRA